MQIGGVGSRILLFYDKKFDYVIELLKTVYSTEFQGMSPFLQIFL